MKGHPGHFLTEQYSEKFMDHVRQVCTFAKLIPGFKCLDRDDQVTLLKLCIFEVLFVRMSGLFENEVSYYLPAILALETNTNNNYFLHRIFSA